ncbi:MAG: PstS family phosphate ABC transporter substrate-binding protein [Rubricoccaceae bacterium]|nr:PstS family phosphate ABC transporter substrate-binding protein [Rubricoccaceae bacterium]
MRTRTLTASLLLALPLLAACGGGDAPESDGLSGAVMVDGSSTVFPITEAVAEEFMLANPGVRVTVGASGTGGGFGKFLRGETDINDASRPIKESERATAEEAGIAFIELPVAYDGIAIVTNPGNSWLECLTTEELAAIWAPGSDVNNWSQVRDGFPDQSLTLYGPGTDSGTYDYFTEAIGGEEGASRADYTASEDDNVLVQGIAGDPNALGFFGLAYYEENAEQLRLVGVDAGNGCIRPDAETIGTGTYQPLARPEFIYVNAARADDPAINAFVRFYLENAPALVREVGYVPLSGDAYAAAMERFESRTTGSVFEGGSAPGVTMEDLLRRGSAAGADTTAAE